MLEDGLDDVLEENLLQYEENIRAGDERFMRKIVDNVVGRRLMRYDQNKNAGDEGYIRGILDNLVNKLELCSIKSRSLETDNIHKLVNLIPYS